MAERRETGRSAAEWLVRKALALVPLAVIGLLWLPVYLAYRVPGIEVTDEMVQQARQSPDDAVLNELSKFDLLDGEMKPQQDLVDTASQLLKGDMETRTCSTHIAVPFSKHDLGNVPAGCQLTLAGFWVPEVWLSAYETTGRQEFLDAAQAAITGTQAYGQGAWFPRGSFWNDHALASRIIVLANFWRLYRHSPQYRSEVARQVLEMTGRTEQMLAKPGLFTFATNHGAMQNLGLWHASLAFPSLPGAQEYRRLAKSRLNDQMKFYISDEGVVLEHSAEYQEFGLMVTGRAFRYLALSHEAAPPEWLEKYRKAEAVYAALRRPDGTLPMFGDTDSVQVGVQVTEFDANGFAQPLARRTDWKPPSAEALYPASGYAVGWDGLEWWPNPEKLSETVLCWSNFAGHGHKHADEMSVLFWADGQNWWSNVGYWPYDTPGREGAVSWEGSNAPHLMGELEGSSRSTQLIGSGQSEALTAIELERTGPEGYVARRQLIHYRPDVWVVLDSTTGPAGERTSTTWTTGTNVRWQPERTPGSFILQNVDAKDSMAVFSISSPTADEKILQKSFKPFAGWQIDIGQPVGAFALVTEQPANSWAAMIWGHENNHAAPIAETPHMSSWTSPTDWELKWRTATDVYTLSRDGARLAIHGDHSPERTIALNTAPSVTLEQAELRNQFQRALLKYPEVPADFDRRMRFTYLLIPIFLLQELFLALCRRFKTHHIWNLRWIAGVAWVVGAVWLFGFHL